MPLPHFITGLSLVTTIGIAFIASTGAAPAATQDSLPRITQFTEEEVDSQPDDFVVSRKTFPARHRCKIALLE